VPGAGEANPILASELAWRKQAVHLIASDQVQSLLSSCHVEAVHACNPKTDQGDLCLSRKGVRLFPEHEPGAGYL
jgi:hypothetical protein